MKKAISILLSLLMLLALCACGATTEIGNREAANAEGVLPDNEVIAAAAAAQGAAVIQKSDAADKTTLKNTPKITKATVTSKPTEKPKATEQSAAVGNAVGSTAPSAALTQEQKIYCKATIDDLFVPGDVLVVLTHAESSVGKKCDAQYFGDLGITAVKAISNTTDPQIAASSTYHHIFLLQLEEATKEAVLRTIKELEKRDDVLVAEPNYEHYDNYFDENADW